MGEGLAFSAISMTPPDDVQRSNLQGVTWRSVGVGLFLALLDNLWVTTSEYVFHSSRMQLSHFPISLLALFLLTLLGNALLARLRPASALSPPEILVTLAMGFVGTAIPTSGLTGFFLGIIASPYYFATPENQWAAAFHPHLPPWAVPSDEGKAVTWFFEGLPPGRTIPWDAWVTPLLWWLAFFAALTGALVCLAVILRRQWAQHERLVYPLVAVAVDLASPPAGGQGLPRMMRGGLFWAGFALTFGVISWNILTYFSPLFPPVPIQGQWVVFIRSVPRIHTKINFLTMGFAYFASLDLLFSIWFFLLVFLAENGVLNRLGYGISSHVVNFAAETAVASWQGFGALTVLVLWGLYTARHHLRAVWRKAVDPSRGIDDAGELMPYRTAVAGLAFGLLFIGFYLSRLGMEVRMIVPLLFALLINYLAMSRIVAETGLAYMRTTLAEQYFAIYTVGSRALSPASLTAMTLTYALVSQGKGLFLPPLVHAARIGDFVRAHRRRLLAGVGVVLVAGLLFDWWLTLRLGYARGAFNFSAWPFSSAGPWAYDNTVSQMRNPFGTEWARVGVFFAGAGAMALLTFLRYRFPAWPLHPIGFPIACSWSTLLAAFTIFLTWAIKATLLKVGGVVLYRRAAPFFVGILAGYTLGVALSFIADAVWFPGAGHEIHGW